MLELPRRRVADLGAYPPIADHGVIGNLRSAALVALDGAIDWCCLPDLDGPSVFAAILDHRRGGRFRVAPADRSAETTATQRYVERTNILVTRFETPQGRLAITDFMPLRGSIVTVESPVTAPQIYRLLHVEQGEVEVDVEWSPRFDYARAPTTIRDHGGVLEARGGGACLRLAGLPPGSARVEETPDGPVARARLRMEDGDRLVLLSWLGDGSPRWGPDDAQSACEDTARIWREWLGKREGPLSPDFPPEWEEAIDRSGLVLKLLTHPHTGAIAAAATTSLPEEIGGVRNWDYRFTWIRDAAFTAQALVALGHRYEALDFLEYAERTSMADDRRTLDLRVLYGLRGETELPEIVLDHLEGYRGSRPVRIGNAAARQEQLDIYGELLSAAWEYARHGGEVDEAMWSFLAAVADHACDRWREPDHGIWEVRGGTRHFVYSKVMVWVALERALRLSSRLGKTGNAVRWSREARAVRAAVLEQGYDPRVGAFVQAFGSTALDAANLLIPTVGFLPFDDPRVQGTIDRTLEKLTVNGLVYRYLSDDGLPGGEGAFGLCTFWLCDALALSGRVDEARELFGKMVSRANHVGLFAEEFDAVTGEFLGNFPQAFSHIGLVNSALYLARAAGRITPVPAPIGTAEHRGEVPTPAAAD